MYVPKKHDICVRNWILDTLYQIVLVNLMSILLKNIKKKCQKREKTQHIKRYSAFQKFNDM